MLRQHHLKSEFIVSDVLHLPFRQGVFDFVVLSEVVEHVHSCFVCLTECNSVLKPGGAAYVSFPPYYGPFGGHLRSHIPFPYAHYLPKFVLRVLIRRKGNVGILTASYLISLFEALNKLTIFRFEAFANAAGFEFHPTASSGRNEFWEITAKWVPAGLREVVALWYVAILIRP